MEKEKGKPASRFKKFIRVVLFIFAIIAVTALCVRAYEAVQWRLIFHRANKVKIGMTTNQVREIMGKPDHHGYNGEFLYKRPVLLEKARFFVDLFLTVTIIKRVRGGPPEVMIGFISGKVYIVEVRPNRRIPFDAKDWERSTPDRRRCMANDFMKKHPPGKTTKKDIISLLGDSYSLGQSGGEYYYVYPVGMGWGPFSNREDLRISFDGNDKVSAYKIWSD